MSETNSVSKLLLFSLIISLILIFILRKYKIFLKHIEYLEYIKYVEHIGLVVLKYRVRVTKVNVFEKYRIVWTHFCGLTFNAYLLHQVFDEEHSQAFWFIEKTSQTTIINKLSIMQGHPTSNLHSQKIHSLLSECFYKVMSNYTYISHSQSSSKKGKKEVIVAWRSPRIMQGGIGCFKMCKQNTSISYIFLEDARSIYIEETKGYI